MKDLKKGEIVNKSCEKCGQKLVVRQNSKNGSWFLGCLGYPECKNTEEIPTHLLLELLGQPRLL
jgi:ssDNA-binding Zn-finger/Zn-ribbon topoisomerase 1